MSHPTAHRDWFEAELEAAPSPTEQFPSAGAAAAAANLTALAERLERLERELAELLALLRGRVR